MWCWPGKMNSAMAYFCRLYISSEALASVLSLCDLFGLKSLLSLPSGERKCACVQAFSIEVFHHLNVPCSFVKHMSHRCFSGSLDTWEIIMNQKKETSLFLIFSWIQNVSGFIKNCVRTWSFWKYSGQSGMVSFDYTVLFFYFYYYSPFTEPCRHVWGQLLGCNNPLNQFP